MVIACIDLELFSPLCHGRQYSILMYFMYSYVMYFPWQYILWKMHEGVLYGYMALHNWLFIYPALCLITMKS